jgi:hypothetical protein
MSKRLEYREIKYRGGINNKLVYFYMEPVYNRTSDIDETTKDFLQRLVLADEGNNPDLKVEFKGYTHDETGFVVNMHHIEVYSQALVDSWVGLADSEGMTCSIQNDMVNSLVIIKCERVQRRRTGMPKSNNIQAKPRLPLTNVLYLSLSLLCLWVLWNRHSKTFLA